MIWSMVGGLPYRGRICMFALKGILRICCLRIIVEDCGKTATLHFLFFCLVSCGILIYSFVRSLIHYFTYSPLLENKIDADA